jgi:regulator of protease activity HflC (stomatin/prohibitin superfamily)
MRRELSINQIKGALLVGGVLLILLAAFFSCTENIRPGYVGVTYDRTVKENGGVLQTPQTGFITVNPITQRVTQFPVSTRTVYLTKDEVEGSEEDESFFLPTKEGQKVSVDINFSYKVDPAKAPQLYYKFRGQSIEFIEQGFIRSNVKSAMCDVAGKYSILGIYGDQRI